MRFEGQIVVTFRGGVSQEEIFRYDQRAKRWKLVLRHGMYGWIERKGSGKRTPIEDLVGAEHLRADGAHRLYTLWSHDLTGIIFYGGLHVSFRFIS